MSLSTLGTGTTVNKTAGDAVEVSFTRDALVVALSDGRTVSAPLESQGAIAVPALIANLSARDGSTRLTVLALGKFGAEAKVAVPALLPLLNDPDRDVRSATSDALKQIDSEAATKAGVR